MKSAPDTVHRNVFDSQHTGATALVTAEAHVPMMTGTLSTSISLRAARTAASGLVWSSSTTVSILRPRTPPALFTSSITPCMALSMRGPSAPPAPVRGVRMPNLSASPWALARIGSAAPAVMAAAPLSSVRRVVLVMGRSPCGGDAENTIGVCSTAPTRCRCHQPRCRDAGSACSARAFRQEAGWRSMGDVPNHAACGPCGQVPVVARSSNCAEYSKDWMSPCHPRRRPPA